MLNQVQECHTVIPWLVSNNFGWYWFYVWRQFVQDNDHTDSFPPKSCIQQWNIIIKILLAVQKELILMHLCNPPGRLSWHFTPPFLIEHLHGMPKVTLQFIFETFWMEIFDHPFWQQPFPIYNYNLPKLKLLPENPSSQHLNSWKHRKCSDVDLVPF